MAQFVRPPANRAVKAQLGVFILRASPYHKGHQWVVENGLESCEHLILVPGSAYAARRWDFLPWTHTERQHMITSCLTPEQRDRVIFLPQIDHANITSWAADLRGAVNDLAVRRCLRDPSIALVGHRKDKPTGYYLSQFNGWASVDVSNRDGLNATPIRHRYIHPDRHEVERYLNSGEVAEQLPEGTIEYLLKFLDNPAYAALLDEKVFMQDYLRDFYDPMEIAAAKAEGRKPRCAPYPPKFFTVDNVVIQGDQVLVVWRRFKPCEGLCAVPGGHLFDDEDAFGSALGELREESQIKVSETILRGSLIGTKTYSDPNRSTRRRTVSQMFAYHLKPPPRGLTDLDAVKDALALPRVKGGDDARKAEWMPIEKFLSREFRQYIMEDHWKMVQDALAMIQQREGLS